MANRCVASLLNYDWVFKKSNKVSSFAAPYNELKISSSLKQVCHPGKFDIANLSSGKVSYKFMC